MIKDLAKIWLILILALFIQSTLFQFIMIKNVFPDLLLLLFVFISIYHGSIKAQVAGFAIGFCVDFLSVAPMGYHAFLLTLIGYIAGKLKGKFSLDRIVFPIILSIAATLMKRTISIVLIYLFSLNYSGASLISWNSLIEILYNIALAPLAYFLFKTLQPFLGIQKRYE